MQILKCFSCKSKNVKSCWWEETLVRTHWNVHQVQCNECKVCGPECDSKTDAIESWNKICKKILYASGIPDHQEIISRQF